MVSRGIGKKISFCELPFLIIRLFMQMLKAAGILGPRALQARLANRAIVKPHPIKVEEQEWIWEEQSKAMIPYVYQETTCFCRRCKASKAASWDDPPPKYQTDGQSWRWPASSEGETMSHGASANHRRHSGDKWVDGAASERSGDAAGLSALSCMGMDDLRADVPRCAETLEQSLEQLKGSTQSEANSPPEATKREGRIHHQFWFQLSQKFQKKRTKPPPNLSSMVQN